MNWWWLPKALKKYAVFKGRSQREEFWLFVLFNWFMGWVIAIIHKITGFAGGYNMLNWLLSLYFCAVLLPLLAVGVRRLHDLGKDGRWLCLYFVPVLGWLWLLWLFLQDSYPGKNEYGPDPKAG